MKAFGAELVLTPAEGSMEFARDTATNLAAQGKGFILDQFSNPDNPRAHYEGTGPEIWRDTNKKITHFISSMGTTGTIVGTSRFLKEMNPKRYCSATFFCTVVMGKAVEQHFERELTMVRGVWTGFERGLFKDPELVSNQCLGIDSLESFANSAAIFHNEEYADGVYMTMITDFAYGVSQLSYCDFTAPFKAISSNCREDDNCTLRSITTNLQQNIFIVMGKISDLVDAFDEFPSPSTP